MLKKIIIQLFFIRFILCYSADYDLYQDYPKGVYQSSEHSIRKEEDLDLSSMAVVREGKISKYDFQEREWKDEAPGISTRQRENTRKIIREFYSFNHSSRWPNNVIPYEVSKELGN